MNLFALDARYALANASDDFADDSDDLADAIDALADDFDNPC